MLTLRRPTLADRDTVEEMMAEFDRSGSASDGGFWDRENFDYEDWFHSMEAMELGLNLPEGWVPAIQFVAFDEEGQAVGFLNLRLRLNDDLLNQGGHIGYSIRPSQRGQGYAKEALRLGLLECPRKNLHRVLITCSETNIASRQVILANGGQLEDVRQGTERYWIELDS